jgi:hypothetical protein
VKFTPPLPAAQQERFHVAMEHVLDERRSQEERWNPEGITGHFPEHRRLAVLVEEVGEVAAELQGGPILTVTNECLRAELVQVAAVAMRWIEALDTEAIAEAKRPPYIPNGPGSSCGACGALPSQLHLDGCTNRLRSLHTGH